MDNFDFVAHLAETNSALDASAQIVEKLLRSYYQEMRELASKWSARLAINADDFDQAFSELNTTHQKFWLPETRFTEYWQPALEPPEAFEISDSGVAIFSDMLGNFVAVIETAECTTMYLLSVVRDELRIVNKFYR